MPERRALRLVHTSEVHLGAYGGRLIEPAFARVVDRRDVEGER